MKEKPTKKAWGHSEDRMAVKRVEVERGACGVANCTREHGVATTDRIIPGACDATYCAVREGA